MNSTNSENLTKLKISNLDLLNYLLNKNKNSNCQHIGGDKNKVPHHFGGDIQKT